MSFPFRYLGAAVIAALTLSISACSPDTAPPDDSSAPEPDSAPTTQGTADQGSDKGTAPDSPAKTANAPEEAKTVPKKFFDLKRKGDQVVLTGRIRSALQARDIAASLEIEGLTLENKLEVDPKTPGVDWGNRIHELLPMLLASVPDLHYRVEDEVITVSGTVKSEQEKLQAHRDITYWMESPLIKGLKNELIVEGGGTDSGGGKGKGKGKGKGGGGKGKGEGEGGGGGPVIE